MMRFGGEDTHGAGREWSPVLKVNTGGLIQFDRYQRLAALAAIITRLPDSGEGPVLDVGGYPGELGVFLPGRRVVVADRPVWCDGTYVCATGLALPFRDASFPVVVSCDVLEHIPPSLRKDFIGELSRVSKSWICLGVPRGTEDVRRAEHLVDLYYTLLFGEPHPWLEEHFRHGLPLPEDIEEIFGTLSLRYETHRNAELRTWLFGMLVNRYLESLRDADERLERFNGWFNSMPTGRGNYPSWYRDIYVAGKSMPATPGAAGESNGALSVSDLSAAFLCAAESSDPRLTYPPSVAVIIVTYNHESSIAECLEALGKSRGITFERIVIDNGSSDGTADIVHDHGVPLLRTGTNLGFASAFNLGSGMTTGEILVSVNPDLCVDPDTIYELAHACIEHRDVGVVGGKLRSWESDSLQHAGGVIYTNYCTGHRGRDEGLDDYDTADHVDYVTGALMAVKRYSFEAVGGLDERFWPAYYEETDMCVRIRKAGNHILYWPRATGRHLENSSLGVASESFFRAYHGSRLRFIAKHIRPCDIPAFIRAERMFRGGRDTHDVEIRALSRAWRGWWWKIPLMRLQERLSR